jgi:hypothetical protein
VATKSTKIAFAADWYGLDVGTATKAYFEQSLLLDQWSGSIAGGDSGHPVFALINNELVLAGPWYRVASGSFDIHWLGPLTSDVNSCIYSLDITYLGSSTGYTVNTVDLSGFPNL